MFHGYSVSTIRIRPLIQGLDCLIPASVRKGLNHIYYFQFLLCKVHIKHGSPKSHCVIQTLLKIVVNDLLKSNIAAISFPAASGRLNHLLPVHYCWPPLTWAPPDSFSSSALQRCSSSSSSARSLWLLSYRTCSSCSSSFRPSHCRTPTPRVNLSCLQRIYLNKDDFFNLRRS